MNNNQLRTKSVGTDAITESAQRLAQEKVNRAQHAYKQQMSAGMTHLLVSAVEDHNPEILGRLAASHQIEGARLLAVGTFTRFVAFAVPCAGAAISVGLGWPIVCGWVGLSLVAAFVLSIHSVGRV